MSKRKSYSNEFKANVVRMILEENRRKVDVGRELGIHPNTITKWIKHHEQQQSTPPEEKDLAAENRALLKKLAELEEENEILKKAAAYFAKNQK